ncbi:hypothetical protein MMC07_003683 [Pseudocyphellaria aurata]|nr:hypothetical protein [Pseudocyphellaria aurata]
MVREKRPSRQTGPSKDPGCPRSRGRPRAVKIDPWDITLLKLLANPQTWSHFTEEDLEEICTKFPEHVPRNENGSISTEWLRYDNDWRHGVRQWQDDLRAGRLDPEWQRQASAAVVERAAGHFDNYKEAEFEEFWGQKQKIPRNMRAGKSAALKLVDLVAANLFRKGDYWVFSRVHTRGTDRIEVVKDCKIEEIGDSTLTFAIPPGILRHARKINQNIAQEAGTQGSEPCSDEDDVVRYTISNVRMLENKIIELDGRIPKSTHSAWTSFRCQRDNQDLGSLYEVRQEYYVFKHLH